MIKLTDELTLAIEKDNSMIRLILYKGIEEFVCRKSTVSDIKQLLHIDNTHLFKGRQQLFRSSDNIVVEVKGMQYGCIKLDELQQIFLSSGGLFVNLIKKTPHRFIFLPNIFVTQ